MKILSFPSGRVEIEIYRLRYLTKQYLTKFSKKYQHLTQLIAVSAFVALVPVVGGAETASGFPETEQHLVYTEGISPVAIADNTVQIVHGESYAQRALRERRRPTRYRAAAPLLAGNYPPCPASFRPFYQEVAPRFGVPWQVLEAIHQVESGKSCHTARRSGGGAVGPMQFLPSTWRHYQWDCTGDGIADITNAFDSICTGAHYIGTGLTGYSLERSIYSYNHSWSYVNKVLAIAREIGFQG